MEQGMQEPAVASWHRFAVSLTLVTLILLALAVWMAHAADAQRAERREQCYAQAVTDHDLVVCDDDFEEGPPTR